MKLICSGFLLEPEYLLHNICTYLPIYLHAKLQILYRRYTSTHKRLYHYSPGFQRPMII